MMGEVGTGMGAFVASYGGILELVLDAGLLVSVLVLAWRLREVSVAQDASSSERIEAALQDLRSLSALAEGQARELDQRLEEYFARWEVARANPPVAENRVPVVEPQDFAALATPSGAEGAAAPGRALPEAISLAGSDLPSVDAMSAGSDPSPARQRVLLELERARRDQEAGVPA